MDQGNVAIVEDLLRSATNAAVVDRLMAEDSVYMSLTFDNPDLKKVMPWAGVHQNGREGVLYTFQTLQTFWSIDDFTITDAFGAGENVAIFGRFTVHSRNQDKSFVSPFSVHAKVNDGKITYLQYMEDTFGTGATFRSKGTWTFAGDPTGLQVQVGE